MKNTLLLMIAALTWSFSAIAGPGHHIEVKIKGAKKDSACILAHYYGQKQYIPQDTAKPDANGAMVFEGKKTLPSGIYLVVMHNKKFFELIVDKEQNFSVETDTTDFVKYMKVKNSKENQLFYDYHQFIAKKYKEVEPLRKKLKEIKNSKDSTEMVQKEIKKIDEEVKKYKVDYPKKHPESFMSKIFLAMQEPDVPEKPKNSPDSLFAFHYYKAHFWDGFDFSDDRLLRTPVFQGKMNQYLQQMTMQHPDSINVAADFLCEKAKANKEVFKYVVSNITYDYETSKIMGFDAVFVHMAKKFYCTKQATWIDSAQTEKICKRGMQLDNLILERPIMPITLIDTTGKPVSLYDVKAKFTLLFFFDPTCGHCKQEAPKLMELYNEKLKAKGVEIYAIGDENHETEWRPFIREKKMNCINVSDLRHQYDFRQLFDIYAFPVIYLLDENKRIRAKRIAVEQLNDFIDMLIKEKERKAK